MMSKKVAIMGGYGGMGRIFAKLFKEEGSDVTICGPTRVKGEAASRELDVLYEPDNIAAAKAADVVVITVPIDVTAKTIEEVAPHIRDGAMVMDLTSVKGWPCQLMAEHAGPKVEVLGTHPVFGPRVGSVDGQVFVLTPVRGRKGLDWLRKILAKHNARIVDSTPEEHDRVMGVVQGLTHFAYISVGKALVDMDIDVKRSRDFSSPVYDLMLDMIGRIIGQNPHLYAEIQMTNPQVLDVHKAYLAAAQKLSKAVKDGDEEAFVRMMVEAARHFDDTERAMGRSDKAIGSLVHEMKKLKRSVGERICLKHIYSDAVHIGTVEKVTGDEVTLRDGSKSQTLRISNLRILGKEKTRKFMAKKYGTVKKDFSVVLDDAADEKLIGELIIEHEGSIMAADVADIYRDKKLGDGRKSVCFSLTIIAEDVRAAQASAKEFFERLGGKLR